MSVFSNYARYYDLLYRDKDYVCEADYVHRLLQRYAPHTKTILELGCGTGHHATLLAQKAYEIHGIDFSQDMLKVANQRLAQMPEELARKLSFTQGDVRNYRTERCFDAVISLFHVMSYQTSNTDLHAAFETAKTHLKPKGVFIFDCWYGPAVLTEQPSVRIKRLEDDVIRVTRLAEPLMYPNDNQVKVNYDVFVQDKKTGAVEKTHETHLMRYLFTPEVDGLFAAQDMARVGAEEWLTGKAPGFDTWSVCFVGGK